MTEEKRREILIKVEGGRVFKSQIRLLLGINKYFWSQNIRDMIEDNPSFAKIYRRYRMRHWVTLPIAERIVKYTLGDEISIKLFHENVQIVDMPKRQKI